MNISAVNKTSSNIGKNINKVYTTNTFKTSVLGGVDEFVSPRKTKTHSSLLKTLFIAAVATLATSCATLRGGNFIYNEATDKIESVDTFKKKNNIENEKVDIETNKYGLYSCYDKDYINQYGIDKWIKDFSDKLTGSCIFDKDNSKVSKIIRSYTNTSHCESEHLPSHAAPIYKDENGVFKRLQVDNNPGVHSENLVEYLKTTDRNYIIYLRDFDINEKQFSKNMENFIGEPYGYISAIQTVIPVIDIDGGLHCSETYVKGIQDQGIFKKANANKITPHTLLHMLINKHLNLFNKEKAKEKTEV